MENRITAENVRINRSSPHISEAFMNRLIARADTNRDTPLNSGFGVEMDEFDDTAATETTAEAKPGEIDPFWANGVAAI